jgi:hypothetical protein
MSIASSLNRIKSAKSAIKEAINAKGGTLTDEHLDMYADAIVNLPSGGGGAEFFKCAAVYGPYKVTRIRVSGAGTTAVNGDYELTELKSGSNEEVWKLIGGNYYLYKINGYNFGIDSDYTKEPYQALYYAEIHSENPDPTSGSWYTGYNYSEDKPTGTEPVPSVTKFQVTMDENVPKTWDGYKAVLTDGVYSFEETLTTGLSYGGAFVPQIGYCYNSDCTIKAGAFWTKIPVDGLVFYAPLSTEAAAAETGQALTANGTITYGTSGSIMCAFFDGSSSITASVPNLPQGSSARTMSVWLKADSFTDQRSAFGYGQQSSGAVCSCDYINGTTLRFCGWYCDTDYDFGSTGQEWHHVILIYDGTTDHIYWDGQLVKSQGQTRNTALTYLISGGYYSNWKGAIAALRIYDRVLSANEIAELANEFTPTA